MKTADKSFTLFITALSSFLVPFMSSSLSIALPSIGKEFEVNAILLSWIPTSYLLAAAIFLLPFGKIADIYGRKLIFTCGMLIYTASSAFLAASNSVAMLISFRILQGIGSSMTFGTSMAILTSVYPVGERGKAIGINVAAVYFGLSVGPPFGGFLTQHLGWRSIFLLNVPIGAIVIIFIFWKLKQEWAEAKGEKFDFIGSIIYSLTLIAIMYGFSLLPKAMGGWLILIGIIGLWAFIIWEMKAKNPILDINLFKNNRVFAFSNLAALVNYSSTFATGFLLSLYLQYVKGFSPQKSGLILVSQPIVMAIFSPFAGRISDKIEPRIVASIGMTFTVMGLFIFIFLGEKMALELIVANLTLLGLGFAIFSSPNTNAVMSSVERKSYGVASATLGTMRLSGQMLSMGIATLMFAVYLGKTQITPEYYPNFLKSVKSIFIVFDALCFVGIFASLARGKKMDYRFNN